MLGEAARFFRRSIPAMALMTCAYHALIVCRRCLHRTTHHPHADDNGRLAIIAQAPPTKVVTTVFNSEVASKSGSAQLRKAFWRGVQSTGYRTAGVMS